MAHHLASTAKTKSEKLRYKMLLKKKKQHFQAEFLSVLSVCLSSRYDANNANFFFFLQNKQKTVLGHFYESVLNRW